MDKERVQQLAARLPPDAAGSTAMAMALLAVQAEAEARTAIPGEDALLEQVELLPTFVNGGARTRQRGRPADPGAPSSCRVSGRGRERSRVTQRPSLPRSGGSGCASCSGAAWAVADRGDAGAEPAAAHRQYGTAATVHTEVAREARHKQEGEPISEPQLDTAQFLRRTAIPARCYPRRGRLGSR